MARGAPRLVICYTCNKYTLCERFKQNPCCPKCGEETANVLRINILRKYGLHPSEFETPNFGQWIDLTAIQHGDRPGEQAVLSWMQDWVDRTSEKKYENSFNEVVDEWLEIGGLGRFKGLKIISEETITPGEISICLKYDEWKSVKSE